MPRIDSVVMSTPQPQASDEAVIWYDDFDGPEKAYTESQGRLDEAQAFGGQGRSMLSWYEKGTRGTGNRKVFFGDSPTGKVVRKGQSFDDIYWGISTKPIGPVVCPRNPVLIKTPYHGPGKQATWQIEVASADQDETVVWRSRPLTDTARVEVNADAGTFVGPLANKSALDAGYVYHFRVRQTSDIGQTSDWSPWHQPIKTE